MPDARLQTVIDNAHAHLSQTQQADGSFGDRLLVNAFILELLRDNQSEIAATICERLADWLTKALAVHVHDEPAIFHAEAFFQALAAVAAYDQRLLSQEVIASAVQYLIAHELAPGGPYRTTTEGNEVAELSANVAIARFVSLVAQPLPKLFAYIKVAISGQTQPPWSLIHNMRYLYDARQATQLLPRAATSAPRTLEATAILLTTHPDSARTAHYRNTIIHSQQADGSWPADSHAFYNSRALTTATMASILASTLSRSEPHKQVLLNNRTRWQAQVLRDAKTIADTHNERLRTALYSMLDRITQADVQDEIGPLALRFADALKVRSTVSRHVLRQLGVANMYTWAAYTIYDDFLDDEGQPEHLPVANVALRSSIALFEYAAPANTFKRLVADTFDAMDAANAWELAHCRFAVQNGSISIGTLPDYDDMAQLYQRSLSHSLPVMGVLAAGGVSLKGQKAKTIHAAFKEYLIIRQLSDDLHDWQEDLQAGHISFVVTHLLRDAKLPSGRQLLTELAPRLEQHFWRMTLASISSEIRLHAQRAQELIIKSGLLASDNVLHDLVQAIETSLSHTLEERQHAYEFLTAYRRSKI